MEGLWEGHLVGWPDGFKVGNSVGVADGCCVGFCVGFIDGKSEGLNVGADKTRGFHMESIKRQPLDLSCNKKLLPRFILKDKDI